MSEAERRAATPPGAGGGWAVSVGPPPSSIHQPPPRTSLLLSSKGMGSPGKAPRTAARPMTSHKSAGYTGPAPGSFGLALPTSPATAADQCAELEDKVHSLLERAAEAAEGGDAAGAVAAARDAARAEHKLCALREAAGQADLVSLPLKFAVGVCLATSYQKAGRGEEALRAYEDMLRSGLFVQQAGWLRLNQGNAFAAQGQHAAAARCYRMALDALPPPFRRLRLDTLRNLAASLAQAGRLAEAAEALEAVVREGAEHQAAFNLVVCAAAMRDPRLLRDSFAQLLAVPPYLTDEERAAATGDGSEGGAGSEAREEAQDPLSRHLAAKQAEAEGFCLLAARLAAPLLGSDGSGAGGDWAAGYDWCGAQLTQAGMPSLAAELQVAKAVEQLWRGRGDEAVATLRRLQRARATADSGGGGVDAAQRPPAVAAALAALRRLEGGAEEAGSTGPMHASSPAQQVDEGNALLAAGQADEALAAYDAALASSATANSNGGSASARPPARLQPAFNAGLACRSLGGGDRARQLFSAVLSAAPATPEAALHVAELAEEAGDDAGAAGWLTRLLAAAPHDSSVLSRLGALQAKLGADASALQCYEEAFRADPTSIDTLSWLGAREVRGQDYAAAIPYFQAAARAQPRETKWPLMVAGCLRRVGDSEGALGVYRSVLARDPANAEAARYVTALNSTEG